MDEHEANEIPKPPLWLRGEWWFSIIALGIAFGMWSWVKAGGSLTSLIH